jgi:hypothetical protein
MNQYLITALISVSTASMTSCTFRVIDDTNDYDIEAVVDSGGDNCHVHIKRVESKKQGTKKVKVSP